MAKITTVTFDLWQTLLLDERDLGHARAMARLEGAQSALAKFGETFDIAHISKAYTSCFQQCRQIRDGGLDVDFREQVAIFVDHINPGLTKRLDGPIMDEIADYYADSFLVHPPPAHEDAVHVLKSIKDMGFAMGLISNTGMTPGFTFRSYMEERSMLEYFHTLTFSDEVKLAKPTSEIFFMTLKAMNAKPEQTIHVGDHVINDVLGAKRCGMKTIWISGFYEREDPNDPETEPDITVDTLAAVVPAVANLAEESVQH